LFDGVAIKDAGEKLLVGLAVDNNGAVSGKDLYLCNSALTLAGSAII
jgi:hypothetical protein